MTPVNYYKQEVKGTDRPKLQMLPFKNQRRHTLSVHCRHMGFFRILRILHDSKHLNLGQESLPNLKFSKYFQPPLQLCTLGGGLSRSFLSFSGLLPPSL